MHPLTFQLKRAHLQGVAFGMKVVEGVEGMTPARFDLLFVIRCGGYGGLEQREIRALLGVGAATVSKMLKRLTELGWLEREICPRDQRRRTVFLTELGGELIDEAIALVIKGKSHVRHFEEAFALWAHDKPVLEAMKACWRTISRIGHRFKDTARHVYEWVYPPPEPDEWIWDQWVDDDEFLEDDRPYKPPLRPDSPRSIARWREWMARERRRVERGDEYDPNEWLDVEPRKRRRRVRDAGSESLG